jgi:hypothetical protein
MYKSSKNFVRIYNNLEWRLKTTFQELYMLGLETRARNDDRIRRRISSPLRLVGKDRRELKLREASYTELAKRANSILESNTIPFSANGIDYRATVPSPDYYHNIFNWDSAFNAKAFVHIDPERAYDEARALVAGQRKDGMIPHIVYIPGSTKDYYPRPHQWQTEGEQLGELQTSGITQPPLLAVGIKYIYDHAPDDEKKKEFLKEMLPHLMDCHDFLKRTHDSENTGLLTVFHPWASGEDNSPLWDESLERIDNSDFPKHMIPDYVKEDVDKNRVDHKAGKASHRPTDKQYYKYIYLIDFYARMGWDYKQIAAESPVAVKDVTMSSIWARANDSLADLLDEAVLLETDEKKRKEYMKKATEYRMDRDDTRKALLDTWGKDIHPDRSGLMQFCNLDVSALCAQEIAEGKRDNNHIIEPTSGIFMPLYAGVFTEEIVTHLLDRLDDPDDFGPQYPVPSLSLKSDKIDTKRYWRGPVWSIINSFIAKGLIEASQCKGLSPETKKRAGEKGIHIAKSTLQMSIECGSQETYNPKGPDAEQGLGFKDFSFNEGANILCINLLIEEGVLPKNFFSLFYSAEDGKKHFMRNSVKPRIHDVWERLHDKGNTIFTNKSPHMN